MPALKAKLLICFVIPFVMVLAASVANVNVCECTDLEEKQKKVALAFLERIVDIKLDAYNVTGYRSVTPDPFVQKSLHPGHIETWLSLNLSSGNDELKITIDFIDGRFHRYYVERPVPEVLITNTPASSNFLKMAGEVLERYRSHFNATYCILLTPLLEQITKLDEEDTIETDKAILKLHPPDENGRISFLWRFRVNNILARPTSLYIEFDKRGLLTSLSDWWGIYRIGNADVNISRETAINMALGLAQNLTEAMGAKIESIEATLQFDGCSERGDCYTLYPEWDVIINYDKIYGTVYGYGVNIWADTGEVSYDAAQFFFGPTEITQPANPLIILFLAALIVAPTLLVFFKMRRRSRDLKRENRSSGLS